MKHVVGTERVFPALGSLAHRSLAILGHTGRYLEVFTIPASVATLNITALISSTQHHWHGVCSGGLTRHSHLTFRYLGIHCLPSTTLPRSRASRGSRAAFLVASYSSHHLRVSHRRLHIRSFNPTFLALIQTILEDTRIPDKHHRHILLMRLGLLKQPSPVKTGRIFEPAFARTSRQLITCAINFRQPFACNPSNNAWAG